MFDPKYATPVADMASLRNASHTYVTYWSDYKPAAVLGVDAVGLFLSEMERLQLWASLLK
jgi:hypothetical protein